jgi:2-polyprenyl-6-methoxyphenol hydroxylase-like FAD-dependent oxidoreductase
MVFMLKRGDLVKIACVGGGPAGLYFALTMKVRDPGHDVTIFERSAAGSPQGWGITLGQDIIDALRVNDAESAAAIESAALRWRDQVVHIRGEQIAGRQAAYSASYIYNISRQALTDILTARALEAGVRIQYEHRVQSLAELPAADLIVAADGASSRLRDISGKFQTEISQGRNRYSWLATDKLFDTFNYLFAKTDAGWIWAYAYAYSSELSTFIVECSQETWAGLFFDAMSMDECAAALEGIFKDNLEGGQVLGRLPDGTSARWLNHRAVSNQEWHDGNVVLIGDSAHTTHFSLGLGTTLAFKDAIGLADNLHGLGPQGDLPAALAAYESQRRADLMRPLTEAHCSAQWFENVPRYAGLKPHQFAALLHARRSPVLPVLPARLAYRLIDATERFGGLHGLRSRLGPVTKVMHGRRRVARRQDDQAARDTPHPAPAGPASGGKGGR